MSDVRLFRVANDSVEEAASLGLRAITHDRHWRLQKGMIGERLHERGMSSPLDK